MKFLKIPLIAEVFMAPKKAKKSFKADIKKEKDSNFGFEVSGKLGT